MCGSVNLSYIFSRVLTTAWHILAAMLIQVNLVHQVSWLSLARTTCIHLAVDLPI